MKGRKIYIIIGLLSVLVCGVVPASNAQKKKTATQKKVREIETQKKSAETEIKESKAELSINEKKVGETLASLRKIEGDIAASNSEIATVRGQLNTIKGNINNLETSINSEEQQLSQLRAEYLKAVKKMRTARKKSSGMTFLFAAKNLSEARRRLRYMGEFSEWKDRRSNEIKGKVEKLKGDKARLEQAKKDKDLAIRKEEAAQSRLKKQQDEQQQVVTTLRAQSEALRNKIAKRQAEAKELSNQISALIAEEKAREAEERRIAQERKEAEEKRLAEERKIAEQKRKAEEKALAEKKAAEEKRLAEERRKAEEKRRAEEKRLAEEKKRNQEKQMAQAKETPAPKPQPSTQPAKPSTPTPPKSQGSATTASNNTDYATARRRRPRSTAGSTSTEQTVTPSVSTPSTEAPTVQTASGTFESMKGKLPKPVSGSFKIVSAFGKHPISPDLPDIMDENLGIDVHVANGASVNAVFDGEVLKVYDRTNTPGFRNIIVVKHGDYITVYANIETLNVRAGQKVKQGQSLGTAGSDFDEPSKGLLHFEVWKNQTHLNPALWIKM